jgi:hypothetical protein
MLIEPDAIVVRFELREKREGRLGEVTLGHGNDSYNSSVPKQVIIVSIAVWGAGK